MEYNGCSFMSLSPHVLLSRATSSRLLAPGTIFNSPGFFVDPLSK